MTLNSTGQLIVSTCCAIYAIDIEGNKATIVAGKDVAGYKDGKLDEALFDHPDGVLCIDSLIFVADTYNHRIRVVDLESSEMTVSTIAVRLHPKPEGHRGGWTSGWAMLEGDFEVPTEN